MWLWALTGWGISADPEMIPGSLNKKVACLNDSQFSYALYLPSSYATAKRFPLVICLDPGGNGLTPVELLRGAAEELGYILAGSLDVRNGPPEPTVQALRAMWRDLTSRLAIDAQRLYAAGFSGGARTACALGAILARPMAGVIACGAGLPTGMKAEWLGRAVVFATVGLYDFNYQEMTKLESLLQTSAIVHHIEKFTGPHAWAPQPLMERAMRWLELQAMKTNLIPRDNAWLEDRFAQELLRCQDLEKNLKIPEACLAYRFLVSDFSGLHDVQEGEKKVRELEKTDVWRQYISAEKESSEEENEIRNRLTNAYREFNMSAGNPGQVSRLATAMKLPHLVAAAKKKKETADGIIAQRLLSELRYIAFSDSLDAWQKNDHPRAIALMELVGRTDPDNWRSDFNLATFHVQIGDHKKALKLLDSAIKKGLADPSLITQDNDWSALARNPELINLLKKMKK